MQVEKIRAIMQATVITLKKPHLLRPLQFHLIIEVEDVQTQQTWML